MELDGDEGKGDQEGVGVSLAQAVRSGGRITVGVADLAETDQIL